MQANLILDVYTLFGQKRVEEAAMLAQNAVIQQPDSLEAKVAMAVVARRTGRLSAARMYLTEVLDLLPQHTFANFELGRLHLDEGDLEAAHKAFLTTAELMPGAAVSKDLGLTLMLMDRRDEAIPHLEAAAKGLPGDFAVHQALGVALIGRGDIKRGIAALQKVIPGKRTEALWQWQYAQILAQGRMDQQAFQAAKVATEIDPKFVPAWETQYFMLHNFRDNEGALKIARKLLALDPSAYHQMMVGHMEGGLGRYSDARRSFERALEMDPQHLQTLSGYCFFTTYMDDMTPQQVFDVHRRYGEVVESMIRPIELPAHHDKTPGRRLRIGLVSADFREHAFSKWALPMLEQIDREQYALYYYYAHHHMDDYSMRYMATSERWRTLVEKSDKELAALIADDQIDILIDCSVHTGGTRLPVFAYKPAPIQVTWGGSPFTTGLTRVDYRITDELLDPPGMTECFNTETLWRLPRLAGSLEPRPREIVPGPLPALERGYITFGAFNRIAKVNELTLAIWADVMKTVENSKLVVVTEPDQKSAGGRTTWLLEAMEKHGIARERITTLPPLPLGHYLNLYNQVDIHLDTFPYTGSTTTIDALGMGVPVVTMASEMPTSRASLVILGAVGHLEWVAEDRAGLVNLIQSLASDVQRLSEIRAALPDEVAASSLYDAKGAAEAMQDAFRGMWQRWCEQQNKA